MEVEVTNGNQPIWLVFDVIIIVSIPGNSHPNKMYTLNAMSDKYLNLKL